MRGPFKEQVLDEIVSRGVPVGTVLDVGVLNGTPELKRAFPQKKHVLFEPVEEYFDYIAASYAHMDFELVSKAVSRSSGTTQLEVRRELDHLPVSHSEVVETTKEGRAYREVGMTTLDDFLRGRSFAQPYLLKIDIDGHELAALEGARNTLPKCSVVIVETQVEELADRIKAVNEAGFRLLDLSEPAYYDNALWQCDAVFLRKDLHEKYFAQLGRNHDPKLYTLFR